MSYQLSRLDQSYNDVQMQRIFGDAAYIVALYRPWFNREYYSYKLHPIVTHAMRLCRPLDWHQLLLEWPHVSTTDASKIAYTRDERSGEADRQAVTTPGRYLTRHFPMLPDHYVRDLVAMHIAGPDQFKLLYTTEEIVHAVQNGPTSCMQWDEDDIDRLGHHPYEVYDPALGWHMAVRIERDGVICGRALCMQPDSGTRYFVRSYRRSREGGYSHPDEALAAWLKEQGYEHHGDWAGERLRYIPTPREFLAPYIDGGAQAVCVVRYPGKPVTLEICHESGGEWVCNNTNGVPDEVSGTTCEDCDDRVREDDVCYVGQYEDRAVCESCRDYNYTCVLGRRRNRFYVDNDEAIEVDGEYYDVNYLSDNDIVCDVDGDYQHQDSCVYIEDDGEWYLADDERIVENEDGEWVLRTEEA